MHGATSPLPVAGEGQGEGQNVKARVGYSQANIATREIKSTILSHPEFDAYADRIARRFDEWRHAHEASLKSIKINDIPKQLIHRLSEDLLTRFTDVPLLNRYDVYQRLMDYWAETMQDDVYLIAADGWMDAAKPRGIVEDKEKKIKEAPDLVIGRKKYKMDLIPPSLIVARYFEAEQKAIDALQAEQEDAARVLEEFIEENNGDEGLLADAMNEKDKVTKASVKERLKEIEPVIPAKAGIQEEFADERAALERCVELIETEAEKAKAVKDAHIELDQKVLARYAELKEGDIKALVVEDKWLAAIRLAIDSELQRLTQQLAARLTELEERYARPLRQLSKDVLHFNKKVEVHIRAMGIEWQ